MTKLRSSKRNRNQSNLDEFGPNYSQVIVPSLGRSDLAHLQNQLGNHTIQRILAENPDQVTLTQVLTKPDGPGAVQRDEQDELSAPQHTNGEVNIQNVEYDYYDVSGSTLAEVARQLDPKEWGRCTYIYDNNYETTNGRTSKVDIELTLTIRLPRWRGEGYQQASETAKGEWNRMLQALSNHEDGHADIARRWAPRFKERLLGQRESNVARRFKQMCRRVNAETKRFDQRTQHGRATGVTLDTTIQ